MPGITDAQFQAAAERLPSTPQVFGRLNAALRDPDIDVGDIAAILKLDAALSARLLRLSNSPGYIGSAPANDLTEAVQRVGFRQVFHLVGVAMSAQLYVAGLPIYGLGGTELWENSLAAAIALEHLAQLTAEPDIRGAYTLGLLRPIGRLLLQRLAVSGLCPPLAGRKATGALVLAWEKATFGLTSVEAAERLFTLWHLSPSLNTSLRYQFSPWDDPEKTKLSALVHLAGWIAQSLGKGLNVEKDVWEISPRVLAQAGLDQATGETCAAKTGETLAELSKLVVAA